MKNNQAEFNRYKALYDQGVVSKEQLDTYESNLGQFVGAIKADQAAIESAQLNVTYCHIKSPIDGKVGLRQVDPGQPDHREHHTDTDRQSVPAHRGVLHAAGGSAPARARQAAARPQARRDRL